MHEAPYEREATSAIRESMLLTEEERAAIHIAELRVCDALHLATILRQADAAILTIQKARAMIERVKTHPED